MACSRSQARSNEEMLLSPAHTVNTFELSDSKQVFSSQSPCCCVFTFCCLFSPWWFCCFRWHLSMVLTCCLVTWSGVSFRENVGVGSHFVLAIAYSAEGGEFSTEESAVCVKKASFNTRSVDKIVYPSARTSQPEARRNLTQCFSSEQWWVVCNPVFTATLWTVTTANNESQLDLEEPTSESDYRAGLGRKCPEIGSLVQ